MMHVTSRNCAVTLKSNDGLIFTPCQRIMAYPILDSPVEGNQGVLLQPMPLERLSLVVIGLGHQSVDDHIPAIVDSSQLQLVGVVDTDAARAADIGEHQRVPWATSTDGLLDSLPMQPNAALIAVPHAGYISIIENLATRGVHILKEKPFAVSFSEAQKIKALVEANNITLQVTLQRRFNPIYRSFQQLVKHIGRIHTIEARYTMNVARLDEGWRASRLYAGGGALIDLGYHYIDLIVWFFGLPDSVMCRLSTGNRDGQLYDVEDAAIVQFDYRNHDDSGNSILGTLIVSRVYPDKDEALIAYGTDGSVSVQRGKVVRRNVHGQELECLERTGSWPSALIDQLEDFASCVRSGDRNGIVERRYLEQAALVEAAYTSAQTNSLTNPREILDGLLDGENRG